MPKTATAPDFRKGTKVVATADLREVPEGTQGKVIMVTGLTWIRYWVRFENGVSLGSIPRAKLATPAELKARLERGDEDEADEGGAGGDDAAPAADAGDGGGVTTANGTFVPQKFIERAAAARARLGG